MWMQRVATGLLAGYQRHVAAAAAGGVPPAAAAALQQACSFSSAKAEPQPFREVVKQVEAALLDPQLPPPVLADNKKVVAVMRQFVKNLEPPGGGWPPPFRHPRLTLVFRDHAAGGQLQPITFHLTTTGGDCQAAVRSRWSKLLQRMGLNPHFYFDGEQFKPPPPPRRPALDLPPRRPAAAPPSPQEVEAVRARAAKAGFPSQTITEEQFQQMQAQSEAGRSQRAEERDALSEAVEALKQIDPLLQALAAVPWLMATGDGPEAERAKMVKTQVLDKIEADGFDVRGAVWRIWLGNRDPHTLMLGKDAGSAAAIKQILFHAQQYDGKFGKQTHSP